MGNPFCYRQEITDPRCFYGRGDVMRTVLEMVASGQSCAVVGERRIGKSSLLAYLANSRVQAAHGLAAERTLAARIDLLGLPDCSPQELWVEILTKLAFAADEEFRPILETTAEREQLTFNEFRHPLRKLCKRGFRVVLLCDEFELAVQNPRLDKNFFRTLRSLTTDADVTFVTASRLKLVELGQYRGEEVRQKVLGSPFFNIFDEVMLGPFEDYEVAEMLGCSLSETPIRFSREEIELLDRIAGRHPYFLQLAAYHLYAGLKSAGLRHSAAKRPGNLHTSYQARHAEILQTVWKRVRAQGATIFPNLWEHCSKVERETLVALAAPFGGFQSIAGGALNDRVVEGLERRGLVRRAGNGSSCRLFSKLLAEWIRANVTGEKMGPGDGP